MAKTRRYKYQTLKQPGRRKASVKAVTYGGLADIAEDVAEGLTEYNKITNAKEGTDAKSVEQLIRNDRERKGLGYKFQNPWHKDLKNYRQAGAEDFAKKHGKVLSEKDFNRALNFISKNSKGEDFSELKGEALKRIAESGEAGRGKWERDKEGNIIGYLPEKKFGAAFQEVTGTSVVKSFSTPETFELDEKYAGMGLMQRLSQAVKREGMSLEEAQRILTQEGGKLNISPNDMAKYRDMLDEAEVAKMTMAERRNNIEQKRLYEKKVRENVQKAIGRENLSAADALTLNRKAVDEKVEIANKALLDGQESLTIYNSRVQSALSSIGLSEVQSQRIRQRRVQMERYVYNSMFEPKAKNIGGIIQEEPYAPRYKETRMFSAELFRRATLDVEGFKQSSLPTSKRALLDAHISGLTIGGENYESTRELVEAMDTDRELWAKTGMSQKTIAKAIATSDTKTIDNLNERLEKAKISLAPPDKRIKGEESDQDVQEDPKKNKENRRGFKERLQDFFGIRF